MIRSRRVSSVLAVALSVSLTGCGAVQTKAENPVGAANLKPSQEDKDAGLVGIAPAFDLKKYQVIAVSRFPVEEPDIKDLDDRELASTMPPLLQSQLVHRLEATGLFTRVVNLSDSQLKPGDEKVLRLDGAITRLAPGSQALRYFVGFGAGRTKVQTEFRFVDVSTGEVLMVTADRRVGAAGMFGGDSKDFIRESFDDVARDLARFLIRLSRGEAPRS